ncbi:PIN domain-containing protein [Streptomyces sp. NPDC059385]|uniref:PIN domain-containing protein n=1 Tax=Streptomyces sp. NPDC059385 TaxID=3346817 RepID=UPI00367D66D2
MANKPTVVIDTSAFFKDLALENEAWVNTLLRSNRNEIVVWVPEVVVQESIRHFARSLEEAVGKMRTGLAPVRSLRLDVDLLPPHKELEEAVRRKADGFGERLRMKLLHAGVRILELPEISHGELLSRAIAEKKPFRLKAQDPEKKGPDGYRDALIWASVAEAAAGFASDETLIIVTNNHKDFCDENGEELAKDLLNDLPDPHPTVKRFSTLDDMLKYLPEPPPPADPASTSLVDSIRDAVLERCEQLYGSSLDEGYDERSYGPSLGSVHLPGAMQNPTFQSIDPDMESFSWELYDRIDEDTLLATARINADITLDGFADKGSYGSELEVHEFDWNSHMSWVYVERSVQLTFNLTIDAKNEDVDVTFEGGDEIPEAGQ